MAEGPPLRGAWLHLGNPGWETTPELMGRFKEVGGRGASSDIGLNRLEQVLVVDRELFEQPPGECAQRALLLVGDAQLQIRLCEIRQCLDAAGVRFLSNEKI